MLYRQNSSLEDIGSNRQGTSLTVKDLIAMSRVKDCLSGALLFVKEVVMMTDVYCGQPAGLKIKMKRL